MTVESNNLQKGSNTESNEYSKYHPYRMCPILILVQNVKKKNIIEG